jgi:hypothetical protein
MQYYNYCGINGSSLSFQVDTDNAGQYEFTVDLEECIDGGEGGGAYLYWGELDVSYDYDGKNWFSYQPIDYYYGEGGGSPYCSVQSDGLTACQTDVRLPVLWVPISGDIYKSDVSTEQYWSYDGYDGYGYYYGYNSLWPAVGPLSGVIDGDQQYQIMVPFGGGDFYLYNQSNGNYFWIQVGVQSLDGVQQDLADSELVTAPVTFTLFDDSGNPVANAPLQIYPNSINNTQLVEATTDANGEVTQAFPLGYVYAYTGAAPFYYADGALRQKDVPVRIDLNSPHTCEVVGTLFDEFGQPRGNTMFNVYSGGSGVSLLVTTDAAGEFMFESKPGELNIDGIFNYYYYGRSIDNCRPEGGSPRQVRRDFILPTSESSIGQMGL